MVLDISTVTIQQQSILYIILYKYIKIFEIEIFGKRI